MASWVKPHLPNAALLILPTSPQSRPGWARSILCPFPTPRQTRKVKIFDRQRKPPDVLRPCLPSESSNEQTDCVCSDPIHEIRTRKPREGTAPCAEPLRSCCLYSKGPQSHDALLFGCMRLCPCYLRSWFTWRQQAAQAFRRCCALAGKVLHNSTGQASWVPVS